MMQQHRLLQVPLTVIRDLRCRHCGWYVTCGPVFVVPDGGILCGRCSYIAKPQFRNVAFESLAGHFLFPCHNWPRRCDAQLQWNGAIVHEPQCSFRSVCTLLWVHPTFLFKPERKVSITNDIQLHHVPDRILPHLLCELCFNYLSCEPVYIRDDGKSICHRCIHSNGIPEGVLRNLAYEKLASITIFPCMHKVKGCTMRLPYGRDLWRHEGICSYGQPPKRMPSKKQKSNAKERGVIMTHSGHYYGTITPNAALWAPPKSEKHDPNVEVNKEFLMKQNIRNEEETNKSLQGKHVLESENGTFKAESVATTAESSRRTSLSSDIVKKPGEAQTPKQLSPRLFRRHNQVDESDEIPRFSVQYNHDHSDIPRASLPVNPYFKRNFVHHNDLEEQIYGSLDYSQSFKQPTNELIQPKRAESFRVGNAKVINELKMRHKIKKSQESDYDSLGSDEPLDSLTYSEVFENDHASNTQ